MHKARGCGGGGMMIPPNVTHGPLLATKFKWGFCRKVKGGGVGNVQKVHFLEVPPPPPPKKKTKKQKQILANPQAWSQLGVKKSLLTPFHLKFNPALGVTLWEKPCLGVKFGGVTVLNSHVEVLKSMCKSYMKMYMYMTYLKIATENKLISVNIPGTRKLFW